MADHTLKGTVKDQQNQAVVLTKLSVYQVWPGSRKRIKKGKTDNTGKYNITVTPEETSGWIGKPKVVVEVYDQMGTLLKASALTELSAPTVTIPIQLDTAFAPPPLFNVLRAALHEKLHGADEDTLTDQDLPSLQEELAGELSAGALAELPRFLAALREANRSALLPAELFFALPANTTLPALTDASIRTACTQAVTDQRIAGLNIETVLGQVETLRHNSGYYVESLYSGRVVHAATGQPLAGLRVEISKDNNVTFGEEYTNESGRFELALHLPPTETAARKLKVFHAANLLHTQNLPVTGPLADIGITPPPPEDTSVTVETWAQSAGVALPASLKQHLAAKNVVTLRDLRRRTQLDAGVTGVAAGLVKRLDAHAALNLLAGVTTATADKLHNKGFSTPEDIARNNRRQFIRTMGGNAGIGDNQAGMIWTQAAETAALIDAMTTDLMTSPAGSTPPEEGDFGELAGVMAEPCIHDACADALSRAAYLADLLDFALHHIEVNNQPLTFATLEQTLLQPFENLPVSCTDNDSAVLQIRLCIKVLRRFLQAQPPAVAAAAVLAQQERQVMTEVYTTLLQKLGASFAELRQARAVTPAKAKALARQLGILPAALGNLLLDPAVFTEADLERIFGWRDTHRAPLTEPTAAPEFLTARRNFLAAAWKKEDEDNQIVAIDPDLVSPGHLIDPASGQAVALWAARQGQLQTEYARLKALLQQNSNNNQAAFNALLPANITRAVLDEKIGPVAAAFLKKTEGLIQENAAILQEEWEAVFSILVQFHKNNVLRLTWLNEERSAGLYLNPTVFRLPDVVFDLEGRPAPAPVSVWRAPADALRALEKTIETRAEMQRNAAIQLSDAVAMAEKTGLTALRAALIMAGQAEGADLLAKSRWITRNLLIDADSDVFQPTTRLAQAAESLQLLVTALQRGAWQQNHAGWTINLDFFEEKWKWLGSFQTWRAAMMVFLFPENLLYPGLHRRMSSALESLIEQTRQGSGLNPDKARQLAQAYDTYYQDICNLQPEAAVVAETSYSSDSQPQGVYTYVFAKGISGKIYWTRFSFSADIDEDDQRLWEEVPLRGDAAVQVADIIGASVYWDKAGKRRIFLFLKTLQGSVQKLAFTTFDLKTSTWAGELTEPGGLPEDATAFEATVKINRNQRQAPHLFVRLSGPRSVWDRRLNTEGTDWGGDDWTLTLSEALGKKFSTLLGVAETATTVDSATHVERYVFMQNADAIYYRIFGAYDDGVWTKLHTGQATWLGLSLGTQPDANNGLTRDRVYTFYRPEGLTSTLCSRIRPKGKPGEREIVTFTGKEGLKRFNTDWLIPNAGLDLDKIFVASGESVLHVLSGSGSEEAKKVLELFQPDRIGHSLGQNGIYAADLCRKVNLFNFSDSVHLYQILDLLIAGSSIAARQRIIRPASEHDHRRYSSDIVSTEIIKRPIRRIINLHNPFFFNQLHFIHAETVQHDSPSSGLFNAVFSIADDGNLSFSKASGLLAPLSIDYTEVYPATDAVHLAARKQHTRSVLQRHGTSNPGLVHYFYEAYFAVPMQLAGQLQRQGHYREALSAYRLVLDYTQPTPKARKIWAGLTGEESVAGSFERTVAWIKDPLNPHAIAGARRNAYTRHTLLTVLRCLLDFANSEFGRDSAESRAQAKNLYLSALELMDSSDLNIKDAAWEAQLRKMTRALQQKMPTGWDSWINAIADRVKALGSAAKVETTAQKIKDKAEATAFPAVVNKVETEIKNAEQNPAATRTLGQALADKAAKKEKARRMIQKSLTANVTADQHTRVRKSAEARQLAALTGQDAGLLLTTAMDMAAWYKGTGATDDEQHNWLIQKGNLGVGFAEAPGAPYAFCIPDNPMTQALRLEILLNLYKLNHSLNIAGDERPIEIEDITLSVDDLPVLGGNGAITLPAAITYLPTPYTYAALIERAKQLTGLAQQLESSLLSVLERRDAEAYSFLRARHELHTAFEQVRLQSIRISAAEGNLRVAEIQKEKTGFQQEHYQNLLDEGLIGQEIAVMASHAMAAVIYTTAAAVGSWKFWKEEEAIRNLGQAASANASFFQTLASNARREQEWQFALKLSNFDYRISTQEVTNASNNLRMVNQEHQIARQNSEQAQQVIDFLANKFTNAELFDWMSGILENIYADTLYIATATARLAEQQLNFERHTQSRVFIRSDYWQPARSLAGGSDIGSAAPDRRGMTGSSRLQFDITQLDQHAFTTDQRKLQLSKTFSLAQLAPVDFQQFRETGVLPFTTLMEYFDRDFPGHYLRLIQSVQVSIAALVPPVDGVKATLRANGISRVVCGEPQFQEAELRRQPESIAFTSPVGATGLLELRPDPAKLRPFENMGVAAAWTLELPKAANQFDYNSIADVFLKIDYTALESQAYREQVVQRLDRRFSADRVFSFRRELSDQWYDLNHPELVGAERQMVVSFSTSLTDFPPNLEEVNISDLVLFFVRKDGFKEEIPMRYLRFRQGTTTLGGSIDQNLNTLNGVLSTRTGNFTQWNVFHQKAPVGEWELALPNTEVVQQLFKNEQIEELLFVITYEGLTPAW